MKKNLSSDTVAFLLISLMLISSLTTLSYNISYAQPSSMSFTSGEKINFTSDVEMTFKSDKQMQFWSGVQMKFGLNITIKFIEAGPMPDGYLYSCDEIMIIWTHPPGYTPPVCSWWEVIDPMTGALLGEFHIDLVIGPDLVHVGTMWPDMPIPFPAGGELIARKKIDVIAPCEYFEVHWPSGWWPQPCTWWEIIDPETGRLTGYEFHVDWTNESCEFHIDKVIPGPYYPAFPWYEIWARRKIPSIETCDYFVVEEPPDWWPEPCTWWEIIDPDTGEPTSYNFHVDWTNESCEFHVGEMHPGPYTFEFPVPFVRAEQKITNITECDWFIVVDPAGFLPDPCSWWEILDDAGAPTGLEFHVDETDGISLFHVDSTLPDPVIQIPPSYTVTVRKKIDTIRQCDWFRVDDPSLTPEICSWWEILDSVTGDPTGWEFHVDDTIPADGLFHVDTVIPGAAELPPSHELTAERKIDDIQQCDWFVVIDPLGWVPEPSSWWKIIWPIEWAGVTFHVDSNDGVNMFHIDQIDQMATPPTPPPWNVTAEPTEPPPEPWYIKSPYPDYAPSGMPDFDERQDEWWWRAWAFPDAVAVWQHNETVDQGGQHGTWDWDIYYSIYTDPNTWWTLGCQKARAITADSLAPGPAYFLPGDDMEPAISWNGSNYAIAVWQHYDLYEMDWDIWYSVFTPNVGWTWPAPVVQAMGADLDPAIAFDTNGYAVCVWRHYVEPSPGVPGYWIAYDVWNPITMSWSGMINFIPANNAWTPEVSIDSQHNVVAIWTDTFGAPGTEQVWHSWATAPPPGPPLAWSAPAIIPNCPLGMNWQKGISPDNLGNNLIDFGHPFPVAAGEPIYYAQFTSPSKAWTIMTSNLTTPQTDGEHPDLAFDLNNNAIAVYTKWAPVTPPAGELWFSFWNGANWAPVGGAFAATANAIMDQWPAIAFIPNNKAVVVWQAYPEPNPNPAKANLSEIYYSVYTPPYPPGNWTTAATIMPTGTFLTGDDYYVDIASPTGSPTTPPSVPPPPPPPSNPFWTYCGPTAAANSIWWFDSKYEPNNVPPPTISDGFPLVKSYNPGVWDDHDPRNAQPLIEHLAWLMDQDGQRTKLCHVGSYVWDMQAGITHYLSWSGVNPLGDVDGDGNVTLKDVAIVGAAMGTSPGMPGWDLRADIWPETVTGPGTADNVINANDLNLVNANVGKKGMFYEHTTDSCPDFYYIEDEVYKSQDVILLLGFYQDGVRDGGHFVTVAGVNSTTQQLLLSNPIRDEFEAGTTPGRSPVSHPYPHNSTVHNNASLVSHDAYTVVQKPSGCWMLVGYFSDPSWEAIIEYAVITSPYPGRHDVAVTNVTSPKTVICQTCCGNITVTVENQGTYTETFNVTLYANTTVIQKKNITLTSGQSADMMFLWNTTGWAKGNYTLKAVADTVPGEAETSDNTYIDEWVIVSMLGDITGPDGWPDSKCDIRDVAKVAKLFGVIYPDPRYDPNCDLTGPTYGVPDGKIDIRDVALIAKHFGDIDP